MLSEHNWSPGKDFSCQDHKFPSMKEWEHYIQTYDQTLKQHDEVRTKGADMKEERNIH